MTVWCQFGKYITLREPVAATPELDSHSHYAMYRYFHSYKPITPSTAPLPVRSCQLLTSPSFLPLLPRLPSPVPHRFPVIPPRRPTRPLVMSRPTLYDVVLPGTHDSAAYTTRPDLTSRTSTLPLHSRPLRHLLSTVQTDFARTQTLTILQQLNAGARFLDLRISKRPRSSNDRSFWAIHGMVLCVPLLQIIDQLNAFHAAHPRTTVVTVVRTYNLTLVEEAELAAVFLPALAQPVFRGDAAALRRTPLDDLPANVVAGLLGMPLPVEWGKDAWMDTYSADRKITFLHNVLRTVALRSSREELFVLGWTVTASVLDITVRVLSLGFCRPAVTAEAAKMNERFPLFFDQHRDTLQQKTNVIFFDCFTPKLAAMVNRLNAPMDDTDDSDDL